MINSTDLRSGNYVYFTIRGDRSVKKLTARDICNIETMPSIAEMYGPIPVDENWLVKLGFGNKNEIVADSLGQFYFLECPNTKLKSIHHAQNLHYTLNGLELEIKS